MANVLTIDSESAFVDITVHLASGQMAIKIYPHYGAQEYVSITGRSAQLRQFIEEFDRVVHNGEIRIEHARG